MDSYQIQQTGHQLHTTDDVFDYSPAMKDIEYFLWHELADHYLEMIKGSLYNKENVESIRYTLYTIGLGVVKLFAPFFPTSPKRFTRTHTKPTKAT